MHPRFAPIAVRHGIFAHLAHDTAGNTLMIVAAALLPLAAMIGSGVDMGRAYLSETRLQQACDAGVLAARKRLGTEAAISGTIPDDAELAGERFFNVNFEEGDYGSRDRRFAMSLDEDFSISGDASVAVPTTLMAIFGFGDIPIHVECQAQLNMANTDVMMVLDVTGSMAETNPGDSTSKIEALKSTVRGFYAQLSAAAPSTTRLRFGFVPYSTNVNVGALLRDDWVNTTWKYQSRERFKELGPLTTTTYVRNWIYKSGSVGAASVLSSYAATYHPGSAGYTYVDANEKVVTVPPKAAYYTCDQATPAGSYTAQDQKLSTATEPFAGPPSGTRKIDRYQRTENGTNKWTSRSGATCSVYAQTYNIYVRTYERVTDPYQTTVDKWRYDQLEKDVSNWRTEGNGCVEERGTYEIDDYDHIDLARALDLDIDLVPTSDPATRWSPMYPGVIYERAMKYDGSGSFSTGQKVTTDEYMNPGTLGTAACPPAARKLAPITASQLDAYLSTLTPNGSTYHDIGMIWGGRLLSPTGLFASENADISSTRPSTRHLIFLTDGETAPLDISYSSYGVEPLDRRRWKPGSKYTLTQTVEKRFTAACNEVKRKNISVWVISFGTGANPVMQDCAGADRYFVAADTAALNQTFATIAKRMGELRVTR
uniref:Tad domain-containing protein n=1 Tax=Altererythrobacter segetis TaxID=1104773 RepID=UPI0014095ADD|nr:Tad domain-containing protein [Altererythrobacter segetis]